jgi:hypothetical protein
MENGHILEPHLCLSEVSHLSYGLLATFKSHTITGLDRPLGLQEVEVPRISRQSALEGGEAVSITHRPPLPQEDIPGTHFY